MPQTVAVESPSFRKSLRTACVLLGGVQRVADKAGVQRSNLSTWFRNGKTLSDEGIASVLTAMGLPDGQPSLDHVHEWTLNWHGSTVDEGLAIYFPNGGLVKRAPWSRWGLEPLMTQLLFRAKSRPPEVYALTDQKHSVRAVLRRPAGVPMRLEWFGKNFDWDGCSIDTAAMDISKDDADWLNGGISIDEFDSAWTRRKTTIADIDAYLKEHGVALEDALKVLKKSFL